MAYPAYWEEVAKRMYADGEDRALAAAVRIAGLPPGRMVDNVDVASMFGQWFTDSWRARYWLDDRGRELISADLR